jgi:hypothetical protein
MASTYSTNTQLELITTGEKAGQWGTITNTNLQILEQSATGVASIDMAAASVTLALTDGATSNGKNMYLRLYGTLAANRTLTMPATANRVWFIKDDTNRNGTNKYTLSVLTASGTSQPVPVGATMMCKSDGTNTVTTLLEKGFVPIDHTYTPYLAVAGDQIFCNTSSAILTVTLPASPSTGDEVTIIDSRGNFNSNNVTVGRNGSNIMGAASDDALTVNGQSATLIYLDATRGWAYKNNTTVFPT